MNPWALFGGVLILIATAFGGAHVGKKLEREAWQAERIEMLKDQTERVAAQARQYDSDLKVQQAKARKASEDYEKAISDLDQKHRSIIADINRRGGLRIKLPASACAAASSITEAPGAGGSNEEASTIVRLPGDVERGLLDLASSADQVVEQCRALQNWVRDNGMYGTKE